MRKDFLKISDDPNFPAAIFINITCTCGEMVTLNVHRTDYDRWTGGENIQTVFPLFRPDIREMMISGTCQKCWDKMFSEERE